jgi:hypothetical protein
MKTIHLEKRVSSFSKRHDIPEKQFEKFKQILLNSKRYNDDVGFAMLPSLDVILVTWRIDGFLHVTVEIEQDGEETWVLICISTGESLISQGYLSNEIKLLWESMWNKKYSELRQWDMLISGSW